MKTLLWLLFLVPASALCAPVLFAAAPHEAAWRMEASRGSCLLSHEIPRYGSATFIARPGGELRFEMAPRRQVVEPGVAQLSAAPAWWHHGVETVEMGQIPMLQGSRPIAFDGVLVQRLLQVLEEGKFPSFTYNDWAEESIPVTVALSPVTVRDSLEKFYACQSNLLTYRLSDVGESRLLFPTRSFALSSSAQERLNRVAAFVKADGRVAKVAVDGYADDTGNTKLNLELSERRAKAVADYLKSKGVPASKLLIRSHGSLFAQRPAVKSQDERRVEVALWR